MVRSRAQRRPQATALRSARRAIKHRRQFTPRDDAPAAKPTVREREDPAAR